MVTVTGWGVDLENDVLFLSQDRHPMTFPMVAFGTGFLGAMLGGFAEGFLGVVKLEEN